MLVFLTLLFLALPQAAAPPVLEGPPSPADFRVELLALFNQERTVAGAPPLRLDEALNPVAQESAEEVRANEGVAPYDEKSIPRIQGRLRKAGYRAHGWHQAFAAGRGDPATLLGWLKTEYPDTFRSLMNPDFQELGIGISEIRGMPVYTFFLAWRESESFARQTAGLADLENARAAALARVNAERAAAGLPPLALDARLNAAAQAHAEDMLLRSYYNHSTPEGAGASARVRKSGYPARLVAENIARGPVAVNEAMDNWMASREHRRNILHPGFTHLGVGIAVGRNSIGDTVLWVQDFGAGAP